jgi:hypothetical protein
MHHTWVGKALLGHTEVQEQGVWELFKAQQDAYHGVSKWSMGVTES